MSDEGVKIYGSHAGVFSADHFIPRQECYFDGYSVDEKQDRSLSAEMATQLQRFLPRVLDLQKRVGCPFGSAVDSQDQEVELPQLAFSTGVGSDPRLSLLSPYRMLTGANPQIVSMFQRPLQLASMLALSSRCSHILPGDLILVQTSGIAYNAARYLANQRFDHVGVCIGNNQFVHISPPCARILPLHILLDPRRNGVVIRPNLSEQDRSVFVTQIIQLVGQKYNSQRLFYTLGTLMKQKFLPSNSTNNTEDMNKNAWKSPSKDIFHQRPMKDDLICTDATMQVLLQASSAFRQTLQHAHTTGMIGTHVYGTPSTRARLVPLHQSAPTRGNWGFDDFLALCGHNHTKDTTEPSSSERAKLEQVLFYTVKINPPLSIHRAKRLLKYTQMLVKGKYPSGCICKRESPVLCHVCIYFLQQLSIIPGMPPLNLLVHATGSKLVQCLLFAQNPQQNTNNSVETDIAMYQLHAMYLQECEEAADQEELGHDDYSTASLFTDEAIAQMKQRANQVVENLPPLPNETQLQMQFQSLWGALENSSQADKAREQMQKLIHFTGKSHSPKEHVSNASNIPFSLPTVFSTLSTRALLRVWMVLRPALRLYLVSLALATRFPLLAGVLPATRFALYSVLAIGILLLPVDSTKATRTHLRQMDSTLHQLVKKALDLDKTDTNTALLAWRLLALLLKDMLFLDVLQDVATTLKQKATLLLRTLDANKHNCEHCDGHVTEWKSKTRIHNKL